MAGQTFAGRTAMRIIAALCGLSAGTAFVPSLVFPFASLFAFDAPGSGSTLSPYLIVAGLYSVPAALAGSAACAIVCLVRPTWRWLVGAIILLAVPAAIAAFVFDPFHWRHYPPPTNCERVEDGTPHGKWVCRPLLPRTIS